MTKHNTWDNRGSCNLMVFFMVIYIRSIDTTGKTDYRPTLVGPKTKNPHQNRNRNRPFFPKGKADENWKHRANSRRPPAVKDDVFCVPWWASHRIVSRRFGPGGGKPVEATFLDFIFFLGGGWWVQKKSKQTEQARIWLEVKFLQNEGVCEVFSCYY